MTRRARIVAGAALGLIGAALLVGGWLALHHVGAEGWPTIARVAASFAVAVPSYSIATIGGRMTGRALWRRA